MPSPNNKTLLILAIVGIGIVGAFGAYTQLNPNARIPKEEHRDQLTTKKPVPNVEVKGHEESRKIQLFAPIFSAQDDLSFTVKEVDVPKGEDPRVFAVNEFLKTTKIAPEDAKLLNIDVHDGIAVLSFNSAFFSGYGTDDERALVGGLQKTLGQFREIETLDFRNQGEAVESLGNIELKNVKVDR